MIRKRLILVLCLLTVLCGLRPSYAQQAPPINSYTVVPLGYLSTGPTEAYGINDLGEVVGSSYEQVGGSNVQRGFRWRNGVMTALNALGESYSVAYAINNTGQVVGASFQPTTNRRHACLWDAAGNITDLGTIGVGTESTAVDINSAGQVVGYVTNVGFTRRAVLWQNGQKYDLGTIPGYVSIEATAINDRGQITGYAYTATDTTVVSSPFIWTPHVLNGTTGTFSIPASPSANAISWVINNAGIAGGQCPDPVYPWGRSLPIVWSGSGYATLTLLLFPITWHYPGSEAGYITDINDAGYVIGNNQFEFWTEWGEQGFSTLAFLWDPVNGTRDIAKMAGNSFYPFENTHCYARAINSSGAVIISYQGVSYLLNPSPAPPPVSLMAAPGDAKVMLSWSSPPTATRYTLKRSTSSTGPFTTVASGITGTTYTDSGLVNGTTYYYVVSASNAWEESANSNVAVGSPTSPPAAPTGLTATGLPYLVTLSWNESPGATYYFVYRSTNAGGPYEGVGSSDGPYYDDYSVSNGTTYYYVVTAGNSSAQSGYSAEASATPLLPPPPPAPRNLQATAGNQQVTLTWAGSADAMGYNIMRSTTPNGPWGTIGYTYSPDSTTYTDTGLTNGTTYYYVVVATNLGGESPNSNVVSARPTGPVASPPAPPKKLTASPGTRKVSLSWKQSATSGVTQNRIYRSTTRGGSYTLLATVSARTSYTDTAVNTRTTYYYVVTAVKSGQESAYSNEASAKPR